MLYSDRRGTLTHRDEKWFEEGEGGFRAVQLGGAIGKGRRTLCFSVLPWLKRDYDAIIVAGYSLPCCGCGFWGSPSIWRSTAV